VSRIGDSLAGKRAYVTQIDQFMGPALVDAFREHGAEVLGAPGAREEDLRAAGHVDVLLCNLGVPAPSTRVHEVSDEALEAVAEAAPEAAAAPAAEEAAAPEAAPAAEEAAAPEAAPAAEEAAAPEAAPAAEEAKPTA